MKVDVRAIGGHATKLTWHALRGFVGALLLVTLVGLALAGITYYFLDATLWPYRLGASVLVFVEAIALGVFIGWKQTIVAAVAYGFTGLRLGGKLVGALFERIGVGDEVQGAMTGPIADGLERVPLAQAEALLSAAVVKLTGDVSQAGWVKRTIQRKTLASVKTYTLARFRDENARQGSVKLPKLRRELEATIDDAIVTHVRGGLWIWTAVISLGLPLLAVVQFFVVRWIAAASGS
ncbi:MAG: hypothetical protein DCC68_05010 [Planctomycetota bacterium]|nr:MAG: hypothetical protein DCC68_05010 [Planctomycetota bacterium]